ncbi:hypothetical protein [Sphingosinicella sp. BN140058]|uniref:hypothetical protein n=1 Tax=Sphingosinicella sp. BN140058 TaxID=1892855 RepID=UPI0010121372|nr:hypothetical protein [Sphingosinicella sp. BN140058]QAY78607.1 hypothetical protein ETR14_20230 [Sphingosinicella sp. BN140058]
MMRFALLLTLVLLSACSGGDDSANANESALLRAPEPVGLEDGAERIECAVAGAEAFAPVCAVERRMTGEGLTLIVRAPNGGFRRLLVTRDGRGVVAADGAVPAKVSPIAANRIEVTIGGDRYRLPATVRQ